MKHKNIKLTLLAMILGLLSASPASASSDSGSPSELKYIGKDNEQPVFELKLNSTHEVIEYVITIKDSYDNVLYSERLRGENISRRYLLNADDYEVVGTTFEIKNSKSKVATIYKIDNNVRVVQDIAVDEVKKKAGKNSEAIIKFSPSLIHCDAYGPTEKDEK